MTTINFPGDSHYYTAGQRVVVNRSNSPDRSEWLTGKIVGYRDIGTKLPIVSSITVLTDTGVILEIDLKHRIEAIPE